MTPEFSQHGSLPFVLQHRSVVLEPGNNRSEEVLSVAQAGSLPAWCPARGEKPVVFLL